MDWIETDRMLLKGYAMGLVVNGVDGGWMWGVGCIMVVIHLAKLLLVGQYMVERRSPHPSTEGAY